MLLSIPESGWRLIAIAVTAFFVIALRMLHDGFKKFAGQQHATGQQTRRAGRSLYVWTLVIVGVVVAATRMASESASTILFLYSVMFAAIPIALLPVRRRLFEASIAQRQSPGVEIKTDRLMMAWIIGFLSTVCLAAALVMTALNRTPN